MDCRCNVEYLYKHRARQVETLPGPDKKNTTGISGGKDSLLCFSFLIT
jgi:tRNA(Ile)-lysidine synthase TilS/MesJ